MRETLKFEGSRNGLDSIRIPALQITVPSVLQFVLNTSLIILAGVLSILMAKEVFHFVEFILLSQETDFHHFLEKILVFFLYFEFISMIVKYFREDYHFPMRYFLYIGITAMIRLIIVHHEDPYNTLIYSFVILILILSYYLINKTPSKRLHKKTQETNKQAV